MSLIALSCSLLSIAVQAKSPIQGLPPELETAGDPPALIRARAASPRLIVPWGGFTSFQVNVNSQQQNIVGDAANEPSICIDPSNPNRLAIGWRQFDSVTSNFRQAGYGYSTDGGQTWTFPGKLENNVFRSDPVLYAKYDGTFYYLSLLQTFYDNMFQSSSGGNSWSMIAPADGGDKEWFTVDNSNSTGRGFLYQIWSTAGNNYGGRQFSRSTDGGLTWMDPINITNQPYWGVPEYDSSGNLYIGGWSDAKGGFVVVRSQNAKNAAVTPSFDLSTSINLGGQISYGTPVNPGGLLGQMWLAVDRSTAAPNPMYALSSVAVNSSNPGDVMIARSLDNNVTWQPPVRVNDDPINSGHYHWMASVAVAPNGRVDAVWNDTRNSSSNTTSSLYYAYSLDHGQHFSANIRLTPSFNQSLGYPNQNKMGDYMGLVSNSAGANIAFAATFNSEEDVYYANVPTPIVVAPSTVTVISGTASGSVSALASVDGQQFTMTGHSARAARPSIDLRVSGHSPSFSPKALLFNLVAKDTFAEPESVALYNWNTHAFETVGTTTSSAGLSTYNVLATGSLTRFVNQSTGVVMADLSWAPGRPVTRSNWIVNIDQAAFNVIP